MVQHVGWPNSQSLHWASAIYQQQLYLDHEDYQTPSSFLTAWSEGRRFMSANARQARGSTFHLHTSAPHPSFSTGALVTASVARRWTVSDKHASVSIAEHRRIYALGALKLRSRACLECALLLLSRYSHKLL
jgi:hypothetical protein